MNPEIIQGTLARLREVELRASTAEQLEALQFSRALLHFIMRRGESGELKEFIERFDTAPLSPMLVFSTKEEADAWLRDHPAPPHGAIIEAAGGLYTVAAARDLHQRKLLPLPPSGEAAHSDDEEEEEQEVGEESAPPVPVPGTTSSLFERYTRTCYYLHELEKRLPLPEQLDAIRSAKVAFEFVMHIGEAYGFEDYLESIRSARESSPLGSFTSREEADTWLMSQPEPPPPTVVAIGSERYATGYDRRRRLRVLSRLPTRQELDAEGR